MVREDDLRLVGFQPINKADKLDAGAHFIEVGDQNPTMASDLGWMTSVAYSPELGHSIGLGFIKRGNDRKGDIVRAYDPVRGKDTQVKITSAHHIDPEGVRQRG